MRRGQRLVDQRYSRLAIRGDQHAYRAYQAELVLDAPRHKNVDATVAAFHDASSHPGIFRFKVSVMKFTYRGIEFIGHRPRLPDPARDSNFQQLPLMRRVVREVVRRAAPLVPFKVRPDISGRNPPHTAPAPPGATGADRPRDTPANVAMVRRNQRVIGTANPLDINIDWNASGPLRRLIEATIRQRLLRAGVQRNPPLSPTLEVEGLMGAAKSSRRFTLAHGRRNDVPHTVVHSDFHDGVWPTQHDKEKAKAQTDSLPHRPDIVDRHELMKAAGALASSPPEDNTVPQGPNSVPNIRHWVWVGPEIARQDVFNMLDFANRHPDHDLNIWTDDRDAIIAALDKLHPEYASRDAFAHRQQYRNAMTARFNEISKFKERLKIQPDRSLFENNGLTDEENKQLQAICLREKNGPLRNYAAYSDVIRLLALLKHGGLYTDVDTKVHRNRPAGNDAKDLTAVKGVVLKKGANSAIGATVGADLIKTALRLVIANYKHDTSDGVTKLRQDYLNQMTIIFGDPDAPDAIWKPVDVTWEAKRKPKVDQDANDAAYAIDRLGLTLRATGPDLLQRVLKGTGKATAMPQGVDFYGYSGAKDWI